MALITLCAFDVPIDFATISLTPKTSQTALTGPPAIIPVPLDAARRTIHHDVKAKDGSGKIVLRAASKGTGIIAGGPVRAVCEVLGVKDIVAKSMGTSNAHNVIRATMKALMKQNSPKQISTIRNKKISEIIEKRG